MKKKTSLPPRTKKSSKTTFNNFMVLVFYEKFNRIDENQIFFKSNMQMVSKQENLPKCPKCNTNKHFVKHCTYNRNVCSIINSEIVTMTVEILRLWCNGCEKTHAVLPDDIIPYCYYGKSFVLYCLRLYYLENKSVCEIVELTNTYEKLIYKFLNRYADEMYSLMLFLKVYLSQLAEELSRQKTIRILFQIENLKEFLMKYFLSSKRIFLMPERQNVVSRKTLVGYDICKNIGFT